jgi:guanylate kinase
MQKKGLLVVLSGPSGTGKGTVCSALLKNKTDIQVSVSCTTRKPREGEVDGVNYFFKTDTEFVAMIDEGKLLEFAKVFDNYYGTPLEYVKEKQEKGFDVLLEIDVQGAMKVKEKYPECVLVFIAPPSLNELSKRIHKRGTENEEQIQKRLAVAASELTWAGKYDYIIVNDKIEHAVDKINCILCAEKQRTERNPDIEELLIQGEEIQ